MQPIVQPLSVWRRKAVFGFLLLAFLISLPVFIFYATGYRYDFSSRTPLFTATGGFNILAEAPDSVIYVNDEEVLNARTFRNAYYIQGLEPGTHRIHVQSPGLHTWVKELMVYPHIVTEVESFNSPLVPQVRLITEYLGSANQSIVLPRSSSTSVLSGIASTTPFIIATSSATSSLVINQEYILLNTLFAEKASTTAAIEAQQKKVEATPFRFATTSPQPLINATTTVVADRMMLYERGGAVYARSLSEATKDIPHYFCADQFWVTETIDNALPIMPGELRPSSSTPPTIVDEDSCRDEIEISNRDLEVRSFAFYPDNTNLVLMQLADGLYIVEIDDRAWQNTQLLYPGTDIEFIVYRGGIFVKQGSLIFELLPEIVSQR